MRQTDGQTEDRETDGDTNRKSEANGRFSQFCKGAYNCQEVTILLLTEEEHQITETKTSPSWTSITLTV